MGEVRVETEIDASPAAVWEILEDIGGWADWNDVIVDGRCDGGLGVRVSCKVAIGPVMFPVQSRTMIWDEGKALAWGEDRGRLVRILHGFEVHESGEGSRLVHYERFEGAIGRAVYPLIKRGLTTNYGLFNDALKRRAEG